MQSNWASRGQLDVSSQRIVRGRTISVATGRPVRAAKVAGPTNWRAAAVMTTVTSAPACTSWLTRAADL